MPTSDTALGDAPMVEAPPPPPMPGPPDPHIHHEPPPPPDEGEQPILVEERAVALLFGDDVEPGDPGEASADVRVDTNVPFRPSGPIPPGPEGVVTPVKPDPDGAAGSSGGQGTSAGDGVTVTTRIERTASGVIVTVSAVILNK